MAQRGFKSTFENWSLEVIIFDRSSEAVLKNLDTGETLLKIKRNYHNFPHHFFRVNGDLWLFFGERYTAQTFYRLRDGLRFDQETGEIWLNVLDNGAGTLLVENAYWGDVYFTSFYDVTRLEEGKWQQIPLKCGNCQKGHWCKCSFVRAANDFFEPKFSTSDSLFFVQLSADWCPECDEYQNPAVSYGHEHENLESRCVFECTLERKGDEMVVIQGEIHGSQEKLMEYVD